MDLPDISQDASVRAIIRMALEEDLGGGPDVTTVSLVPESSRCKAIILSRQDVVVAGTEVARSVFASVDPVLACDRSICDGNVASAGDVVMSIEGSARGILTAERTALNFMQRLSGIATLTRRFVEKVAPYGVDILDTRKTTPGLRALEKYAVRCGGGCNHRMGLYDRVLIKDNHRRLWKKGSESELDKAVLAARAECPGVPVEVEVESVEELKSALNAAPEWILLDNMASEKLAECVAICGGRSRLEASGGITMENVESIAKTGIDAISLGCLTHSAPSVDLSLELVEQRRGVGMWKAERGIEEMARERQ